MKKFNIAVLAIFTLISTGVVAQNNNSISKKEQMKMKVVNMNTTPGKISNNVAVSSRSPKEQMKSDLMKSGTTAQFHELVVNDSGNCMSKLNYTNLSPKEQMKLKVVNQNKCMVASDVATVKDGKCTMCGKNATSLKK